MRHTTIDEEATGQAALYALGALDEDEARAFEEHLAAGCEACAAELREFQCVAADLALAAPPAEPPTQVRSRLLTLVAEGEDVVEESRPTSVEVSQKLNEAAHGVASSSDGQQPNIPEGFVVVRAGEGEWRATADPGVSFKLLFVDREHATVTTIVRMEPGSRIRSHRHLGLEQCLVLEGDVSSGPVEMSAGDFNCSMPGSVHDELTTRGGALLLIVSPESYEPLEPRA